MTKQVLLLVLLAFGVACQKSPAAQTPAATKPAAATQKAQQGQAAAPVKPVPEQLPVTLAKVNGEAISKDEFEKAVKELEGSVGQQVPAEKRSEVYRGLLDRMIAMKLLLQQSKSLNVTVADAEIDGRMKQIQGGFPNEQAFNKALADQHLTIQEVKKDQRDQMIVNKVLESAVVSKVNITPQDVEDFYKKNPDKFVQPEGVHVQHILIRTPQNADAAAKAKAKAEAEAILKQLKAGGDFGKLAREKSQDPGSAQSGGHLPPFPRAKDAPGGQGMVPEFENAAFALTKPGQLSPVVESPFGYHIIKMVERRPSRSVPLLEARVQIENFLKQQQANEKTLAYIDQLKAKSKIEIYI